ncbi:MAG: hypothetical protein ACKO1G_00950 [Microcystis aeruginosa]
MLIFSRRSSAVGRQPDKLLSMGIVRLRPYTLRNRSVRCVPPRCSKKRTRQNLIIIIIDIAVTLLFSLTANLSDKINDDTVVIILLRRIHVCSGKFSTLKGLSNKELAVPEE